VGRIILLAKVRDAGFQVEFFDNADACVVNRQRYHFKLLAASWPEVSPAFGISSARQAPGSAQIDKTRLPENQPVSGVACIFVS